MVVRCNCVQPDPRSGTRLINDEHLSLYIEFNTSYRLTVEDTRGMPPSERKVRGSCSRPDQPKSVLLTVPSPVSYDSCPAHCTL